MSAMLSCILCPLHTGIRTGVGVIFWLWSRRFAMPPRFPRALLPYAAFAPSSGKGLGIQPLAPQLWIAGLAMKPSHQALLVPAPAVNSGIIFIALARRGCLCGFRVSTGRYAWLRWGALLLRLCRGRGFICMEPLSDQDVLVFGPPGVCTPAPLCFAPFASPLGGSGCGVIGIEPLCRSAPVVLRLAALRPPIW